MKFAERLKLLREEKNLRQIDLAKILNISRQSVSNYENGVRFPNDELLLRRIAEFFDVSIDYLLGVTNIRNYYHRNIENIEAKENGIDYKIDKKTALNNLFYEVDDLPSDKIEKITAIIKTIKTLIK
ncbi:DNA-binding transcriptional regulator, XRE-family HTH domain [Caloranaerobacter azorensis DSM 13643]|uniref:DNA-binding transcriptional regulator, XRE-family HTH domain n=1 Tax=Caloranaerobacter azorensis DSM 13643 TaxID=1121264 RepID=A0A1M5UJZ1_9FIRM|nr:helix-turn-helix transcriptional regulator [Caloranaerobacter azorensis]SHH63392.1 DNA-binding transcriptional regulator, XRE-family HTH domain [Caloranaerobacter azorensis DSM 13643]